MMFYYKIVLGLVIVNISLTKATSTDYYIHPKLGDDKFPGKTKSQAFRTLERASQQNLLPGDRLLLAAGQTFYGELSLIDRHGSESQPIVVTSISWNNDSEFSPALIDFKSKPNGILVQGCSHIHISNIHLTGNGYQSGSTPHYNMRCGVLILNKTATLVNNIRLYDLLVFDVFFENEGFKRNAEEVRTANGTQRYGWGIRVMNEHKNAKTSFVNIENCMVRNVSHTGIKLTGLSKNIHDIKVSGNQVLKTGGPGIQMSEVLDVHVMDNTVQYSGSNEDPRKWGRGSGLWTWGSSRVLIEKNKFLYAKGPGDSAGAHIDFNCDNIVLQYNISAYNAGGFCEVLGNTYNCTYRYNLSINDGHREKGVDGAFQEGKIFWLSGYQGEKRERKGPVNFYFYNNTIYCDAHLLSKIAIDKTSKGILIANNIFYLKGGSKMVLGDQDKPDSLNDELLQNVIFQNNLFLENNNWPIDCDIQDSAPFIGDPRFQNAGGIVTRDYIPQNRNLVKNKGMVPHLLPGDSIGLMLPLFMEMDILGNPVGHKPSIGAIEPSY